MLQKTDKPAKPPYRVPPMAEVAASTGSAGLKVVSLFAGCGGSSLGYRMAGFEVVWANEFVPIAAHCYRRNSPGTVVDTRDIRRVEPGEVLKATGLKPGELDLLDGSPPCQAFSTAGRRAKGWGEERAYEHGSRQRNEDMFEQYARLLRGLMPRAFVAENVAGLIKGVAKGYFIETLAAMRAAGYRVQARLLDAQWLGVPQTRQRVIFVGVREDLGTDPAFPSPLPWRYSVRDAVPWIGSASMDTGGSFGGALTGDFTDRAAPVIRGHPSTSNQLKVRRAVLFVGDEKTERRNPDSTWPRGERVDLDTEPCPSVQTWPGSIGSAHTHRIEVEHGADISGYAIGREADKLAQGQRSNKYFQLERASPDAPSPAIMASSAKSLSAAAVIHPTEQRKFTIAELKRICAFPDDFELAGSYAQQWERLGNSVPPLMMYHVACAVRDRVLGPARTHKARGTPARRGTGRRGRG